MAIIANYPCSPQRNMELHVLDRLCTEPPLPLKPLFNPLLSYQRRCLRARQLGALRPAQIERNWLPGVRTGGFLQQSSRRLPGNRYKKKEKQETRLDTRSPFMSRPYRTKSTKPSVASPLLTYSMERSSPRPHLFKLPLPSFSPSPPRPKRLFSRPIRFRIHPVRSKSRLQSIQDNKHFPMLEAVSTPSSASEEELSWESYCQEVNIKSRRVLFQVRKPDSLIAMRDSGGVSPSEMLLPVFPIN